MTNALSEDNFAHKVVSILTPEVTKSLPEGWQGIDTTEKAISWMRDRAEESSFLTIQLLSHQEIVGFVFLNDSIGSKYNRIDLMIGYLLSETAWGKGLGSELIHGLVEWCKRSGDVETISGGVDSENIASIKVLEKNGFRIATEKEAPNDVVFLERRFKH